MTAVVAEDEAAEPSALVASVLLPVAASCGLFAPAGCGMAAPVESALAGAFAEPSDAVVPVFDCVAAADLGPAGFGSVDVVVAAGVVADVAAAATVDAAVVLVCVGCAFVEPAAVSFAAVWTVPFVSAVVAVSDPASGAAVSASVSVCAAAAAADAVADVAVVAVDAADAADAKVDAGWLAAAIAAAAIASGGVPVTVFPVADEGAAGVLVTATVGGMTTATRLWVMTAVASVWEGVVEPLLESVVELSPDDEDVSDFAESSFDAADLVRER
ncbi:hypothetical protein [Bradyrhizobium sp. dw_78]|uniref:hypothetical protein n=1 Tax=Bradyrhizobium sp. dw_78 TaxID=2719793 RepID=UPI001BD5BD75|nr:hypothetical protein [Bradyrhizobium sp. dw_78]